MLTDNQVRAELERIDPIFLKMLDGATLPMHVDKALRRLALSQWALGRIKNKKPFKVKTEFGEHDCYQCVKLIRVAKNAVKGGSNGTETV